MNFDRLNTFLMAAEDLNFTQAARRLGLSQPAVSQQIRELEESLGVSLFERRGRGLLLTPAGERLRTMARPLLREVKQLESEMGAYREVPQGVLRVGASNTPGIYMLPFALGAFTAKHPGVRISLEVADVDVLARHLSEGEADLAVMEDDLGPGRLHGWDKTPLMEDELMLIARPDHPWARQGGVSTDELPSGSFIFRTRQSSTRQLILNTLATAGVDPDSLQTRFELGNTEGLKRAVMAGLGVGFVSRYATDLERQAGLLVEVPITGVAITRTLWLLRPTGAKLAEHQAHFCDLLLGGGWLPARTPTTV
jgi:DNA-binding transcriptional LysR family regulator